MRYYESANLLNFFLTFAPVTDIYDIRRYGKAAFLIASAAVVALFLYFSDGLIRDLSTVERERMQLWADATKELVSATTLADNGSEGADVDFLLGIIQSNTTIPVLLTDAEGNISTATQLQTKLFKIRIEKML